MIDSLDLHPDARDLAISRSRRQKRFCRFTFKNEGHPVGTMAVVSATTSGNLRRQFFRLIDGDPNDFIGATDARARWISDAIGGC